MINKCRFCGSGNVMADVKTSKLDANHIRYTHYVRCKNCHSRGPAIKADCLTSREKTQAINAWNGGV